MSQGILLSELQELHDAGHLILAAVDKIEELEKKCAHKDKLIVDMSRDYREHTDALNEQIILLTEQKDKRNREINELRRQQDRVQGSLVQDVNPPGQFNININQALTQFNRDYVIPLRDRLDRLEHECKRKRT